MSKNSARKIKPVQEGSKDSEMVSESSSQRRISQATDKKISKVYSFVQRICSIKCILFTLIVFLSVNTLVVGSLGFGFFLDSSLRSAAIERKNSFSLIYDKVENVLSGPKLMSDSMMPIISAGFLDYDTVDYEMMLLGLHNSFERLGLNSLIIFNANTEADKFLSFWEFSDGTIQLMRRFSGIDNTSKLEIAICIVDQVTLQCDESTVMYVPWNGEGSITHQSQTIYEKTFVSPPGDSCDIFLAYTHPYHKDGQYVGTIGVAFESGAIKKYLVERTKAPAKSFIVDITSGYMISTSTSSPIFTELDNGTVFQIKAVNHPEYDIRAISRNVKSSFLEKFDNLEIGKHYQSQFGSYYLDFMRYNSDGADWLIVEYSPWTYYVGYSFLFFFLFVGLSGICLFVTVALGTVGSYVISKNIGNLVEEMSKVETLNFTEIKGYQTSPIREIEILQKKFYFLIEKVQTFSAFLPSHVKKKTRGEDSSTNASDHSETSKSSFHSNKSNKSIVSTQETEIAFGFKQNIVQKMVSLCTIFWEHGRDEFNFIKMHIKIIELIERCIKRFHGSMVKFDQKTFLVGFNVDEVNMEHQITAARFATYFSKRAEELNFPVNISIASGISFVAILGSRNQKRQLLFGGLDLFSGQLARHAKKLKKEILVNSNCHESIEMAKGREFQSCAVDIVYVPQYLKKKAITVYHLQSSEKPTNSEWMYVKNVEEKQEIFKEKSNVITYLQSNKLQESLGLIEKDCPMKNNVQQMIERKKSYNTWMDLRIQEKDESMENLENISVFQK